MDTQYKRHGSSPAAAFKDFHKILNVSGHSLTNPELCYWLLLKLSAVLHVVYGTSLSWSFRLCNDVLVLDFSKSSENVLMLFRDAGVKGNLPHLVE